MFRRRRSVRKRGVRRRSRRGGLTLRKLAKKVQRVSLRDRPVYKVYDDHLADQATEGVAYDQYSLTTSPQFKYLGLSKANYIAETPTNQMCQGFNEGQFSGNQIKCVSLTIRGQIYNAGTVANDFTNVIRLIWFWDSEYTSFNGTNYFLVQQNDVQPILGVYDANDSQCLPGSVMSGFNPVTVGKGKRYKILSDRTYTLSAGGQSVKFIHQKIRLGKIMSFVNPNTSERVPEQGIGCLMVSDSSAAPNPIFTFCLRLCYYDN